MRLKIGGFRWRAEKSSNKNQTMSGMVIRRRGRGGFFVDEPGSDEEEDDGGDKERQPRKLDQGAILESRQSQR